VEAYMLKVIEHLLVRGTTKFKPAMLGQLSETCCELQFTAFSDGRRAVKSLVLNFGIRTAFKLLFPNVPS
jgi:hypothetical protein